MLTKLYWITRISGYVACLGGILLYLYHQPDAWALSTRLEWAPRLDRNLVASEMRFAGGGR